MPRSLFTMLILSYFRMYTVWSSLSLWTCFSYLSHNNVVYNFRCAWGDFLRATNKLRHLYPLFFPLFSSVITPSHKFSIRRSCTPCDTQKKQKKNKETLRATFTIAPANRAQLTWIIPSSVAVSAIKSVLPSFTSVLRKGRETLEIVAGRQKYRFIGHSGTNGFRRAQVPIGVSCVFLFCYLFSICIADFGSRSRDNFAEDSRRQV